jgi:ElaA protein
MEIKILKFADLSLDQLYAILQIRSEVFVVEQDCVYQDIDNKDQKAFHIIGSVDEEIVAYTRFFKPGDYFPEASIGRVVVDPAHRGKAYGKKIMEASIAFARSLSVAKVKAEQLTHIKISAQCYLDKFYTDLGFKSTGEKYLEDGIAHQEMIMAINLTAL